MSDTGFRLRAVAIRLAFDNLPESFNRLIRKFLHSRGEFGYTTRDWYSVLEKACLNAIRHLEDPSMKEDPHVLDEVIAQTLRYIAQPDVLDETLDRANADGAGKFRAYLSSRAYSRAFNKVISIQSATKRDPEVPGGLTPRPQLVDAPSDLSDTLSDKTIITRFEEFLKNRLHDMVKPPMVKLMVDLYEGILDGRSLSDIGRDYGMTPQNLNYYQKKLDAVLDRFLLENPDISGGKRIGPANYFQKVKTYG